MSTYNDTAQLNPSTSTRSDAYNLVGFMPASIVTAMGLLVLQPSLLVTVAATICVSFAMLSLAVFSLNESNATNCRKAIRIFSPIFTGLVVWLSVLAGHAAGGGIASIAITALTLPALLLGEGILSILVISMISRLVDQPIDSSAAVLVADKYSGLAGTLR